MSFNFEEYERKCRGMPTEELHTEWENYNREVLARARSIATSVLLSPLTAAHTALARKGGILGKAYEYYRKNSTDQEGSQKHGYEPTPLTVWTNTASIQDVTEQVETLDIEQDLGDHYATPHVGLHPTKTWPANYQAHLLNNGAGLASDAKPQDKVGLKSAQQRSQGGLSRSMSIKSITIRNGQNKPTTMTIEEETLFIRGRLLQLEMIRRGDKPEAYDQNESQALQTTELEVLVEDEVLETTSSDEVHTSFQFWNQVPGQLPFFAPAPTHPPSLESPGHTAISQGGPILQTEQNYPQTPQRVLSYPEQIPSPQTPAQGPLATSQATLSTGPEYQNPLNAPAQYQYSPYFQQVVFHPQQTPLPQSPIQIVTATTGVALPTVPEYQRPSETQTQHQYSSFTPPTQPQEQSLAQNQYSANTPPSQPQEQAPAQHQENIYTSNAPPQIEEQRPANHRKKSQDSGYYSTESTPKTAYTLAPPSFGLPPTAEVPDDEDPEDFIPQDFGLPPETVVPHLSDQHYIEPILSASAISPVVERSLDFASWAPPERSQQVKPESQSVREKNARGSFSATPQEPRQDRKDSQFYLPYEQNQNDSTLSVLSTSPVAQRTLDFGSWAPSESRQQQAKEEKTRYSVSSISQDPPHDSQSYLPYMPPDAGVPTLRDSRSQSVPMFPWKEQQDQKSQYPFSPISPVTEQEPCYIPYSPS